MSATIERWRSQAAKHEPDSASQVRRLEAEISGTQSAVERYYQPAELTAFQDTR